MNKLILPFLFTGLLLLGFFLVDDTEREVQKGISVTAPERPFQSDPLRELKVLGASHVAVIPFAYVRPGDCEVRYNVQKWQWWGERPEGIRETIQWAKKNELEVLLKPQIYIPGSWIGELSFQDSSELACFFNSYWKYLKIFTTMAEEENVEILCVGTEMKALLTEDQLGFRTLLDSVRLHYSGSLTYAANWDNYKNISFWDRMDIIGINAYWPLSEQMTPSVEDLTTAWQPVREELADFSQSLRKPICFTEYGYLSVDQCANKNWELEKNIHQQPINQQCQCNALEALWGVFSQENWWIGGYLWKWFPEGMGHEGYVPRDYTPQGKMAEECLAQKFRAIKN